MPASPAPHALISTSWSFLTNPYVLSAAACGALALALSYFLSVAPATRDAKLRVVAGDVRRVGPSAFVFRSSTPSLPNLLLDASSARIVALHEKKSDSAPGTRPLQSSQIQSDNSDSVRESSAPRISIALPLRSGLFCRDDYQEQHIADIHDLRILDRGLHFRRGRAVSVAAGPDRQETLLQFNSRVAAETFVDVLYHVRFSRQRRPDNVSLFLTTFNVGNSQPPDDLSPWLGAGLQADIVAIGAQECSYTAMTSVNPPPANDHLSRTGSNTDTSSSQEIQSAESVSETTSLLQDDEKQDGMLSKMPSARQVSSHASSNVSGKEHWHSLLTAHFPEDEFTCIAKVSAWDRCLTIFVKTQLVPLVSRARTDTANVGLGRVAGNKGAIGVRFTVLDTNFVIINSHLAAHAKEVNRRNEDFTLIARGLHKLRDNPEVDVLSNMVHHMFWMGDLNYRIDLDRDAVLDLIRDKKWKQLQEADQLIQEMGAGRAFQGFSEGEINFAPTYRYEHGSRNYSAVKLRVPSYCDRILYRSLRGCKVELHEYQPCDEVMTSDHSPVYARFSASLVHTTGNRDLETIAQEAGLQEARDLSIMSPMISPIVSPRSLSMRSLIPGGIGGGAGGTGLQLRFERLCAKEIPDMDYGGRRIAVAKALNIHNHVVWKKHDELGAGQHADPYCTFHGDALAELDEGVYRTRTVTASQNPVWEGDAIPVISLINSVGSSTERRYIIITVKDENPKRPDDVVGSAVLWLGDECRAEEGSADNAVKFTLPIMLAGRRQGEVSGSYTIRKV